MYLWHRVSGLICAVVMMDGNQMHVLFHHYVFFRRSSLNAMSISCMQSDPRLFGGVHIHLAMCCCVSLTLMLFAAAVVFIYSSIMKRRPKSTPKSKCVVISLVRWGVFLAFCLRCQDCTCILVLSFVTLVHKTSHKCQKKKKKTIYASSESWKNTISLLYVWTIFVNLESEGAKKSKYWENHL